MKCSFILHEYIWEITTFKRPVFISYTGKVRIFRYFSRHPVEWTTDNWDDFSTPNCSPIYSEYFRFLFILICQLFKKIQSSKGKMDIGINLTTSKLELGRTGRFSTCFCEDFYFKMRIVHSFTYWFTVQRHIYEYSHEYAGVIKVAPMFFWWNAIFVNQRWLFC